MPGKIFFALQYLFKKPRWDTGITPPEVFQFLEGNSPGKALDLGCGTGTNVLTIAGYGWQVTGVDYIPGAIRRAKMKALQASLTQQVDFIVGDVLDPNLLNESYDLILDIGCFHNFSRPDISLFAKNISSHMNPGATFLLYAHLKENPESAHGVSEENIAVLGKYLNLIQHQDGLEGASRPSAWFRFQKKQQ
ncbi:MAG: class I SAM-dependent methyltransferase [Anaerolineales bacterium]|nr:class I SAM-dependent methyltransferase [Anaerolineales bacterium]